MFFRSALSVAVVIVLFATWSPVSRGAPLLSEFLAANSTTLADEDGAFSDWIELHNPDDAPTNLDGWYLTDSAANKTKWKLPAVILPPGGYLIVFASTKDRRDPTKPLHTNFALSASGEYLGLVQPDGVTVAAEYAPAFPAQTDDVSYGIAQTGSTAGQKGLLRKPTPGLANEALLSAPLQNTVAFSRTPGVFADRIRLELTGAQPGQRIRFVAVAASAGGNVPDPTATSPEYAGPIELTTSTIVRAAVFSADDSAHGPVRSGHYLKLAANVANFSSNLPVIVLDNHGVGPLVRDGIDHPAWLYTYPAQSNGTPVFASAPTVASPLNTTVRGQSSADFPKKSYTLKFLDEFGEERAQAFADFPAQEKWALVAPWHYDRTFLHNAFAYALSNQLGRWAPRTQLVEVFFNSDGGELDASSYAGIYVLTDRIEVDDARVDIRSISRSDTGPSSITGGYIVKIDLKDEDEYGFITERGVPDNTVSSVVIAHPKDDDLAPAQRDYIRSYVQRMEDALHADRATGWATRTYLDYIDRASWVDHHLLNTLAGNVDAFERSAYFTKDRGGKLVAGPLWDFDRSLGSSDFRNDRSDGWIGDDVVVRSLWSHGWWELLTADPEFMQEWIDRWQTLRRSAWANPTLTTLIDSLATIVGPAAAARDAARWPDNASRFGDYAGEIAHMKQWLSQRADWIDRQFVAAPTVVVLGDILRISPASGTQLVYTVDGSDPRSLGGQVAPNARFSMEPLDLPASTNVHARSYRAELRGVFPGSPWSSAVGGASSSPLSPQARLVNLSSRGFVGTGENALIAGVVVADTATKRYIARGVGPGLAIFGATGLVPDPQLGVFTSAGVEIERNNSWETGSDAADLPNYFRSVGAFPLAAGSKDAALASEKSPGAYTLQITTPSGQEGVGLAELYELDGAGRTLNLSTRAMVRTGVGVLVGGFVIRGASHKRMLIRGVGPTLAGFGVTNALADPILTLYSGQNPIATNDRWKASADAAVIETAMGRVGAFALGADSEDAVLFVTVPPGAYTVEIRGKNETEGVALLEIYEVP